MNEKEKCMHLWLSVIPSNFVQGSTVNLRFINNSFYTLLTENATKNEEVLMIPLKWRIDEKRNHAFLIEYETTSNFVQDSVVKLKPINNYFILYS